MEVDNMATYTGIVTKKNDPKVYSDGNMKFYMQISDSEGNIMNNSYGEELKIMVIIQNEDDERNKICVNDIIELKTRDDPSGWLKIKQEKDYIKIVEKREPASPPKKEKTIIVKVKGRGKIKNYSGIYKFFMCYEHEGHEQKCMVSVGDQYFGIYEDDAVDADPVEKIAVGDTIKITMKVNGKEEWLNLEKSQIEVLDDSGQKEWEIKKEEWKANKEKEKSDRKNALEKPYVDWFKETYGIKRSYAAIKLMCEVMADLEGYARAEGTGGRRNIDGMGWEKPTGLRAGSLHYKPANQRKLALDTIIDLGFATLGTGDVKGNKKGFYYRTEKGKEFHDSFKAKTKEFPSKPALDTA